MKEKLMQEGNNPKNRNPRGTIAMQATGSAHQREDHHHHQQGNIGLCYQLYNFVSDMI
jgi:hypothetical protein